jgi:hypothetical protein
MNVTMVHLLNVTDTAWRIRMIRDCNDCRYEARDWDQEPCDICEDAECWEPVKFTEELVGVKDDSSKVRLDLIPPEALFAAGEVFTIGAKKYGDRNWEKGIDQNRLYASVLRHLYAWQMGEKINTSDGDCTHLAHALTNLMMMVTQERRNK